MKHTYQSIKIGLLLMSFTLLTFSSLSFNSQVQKNSPVKLDIEKIFYTSGWMGDGQYGEKYIQFKGAYSSSPHSLPLCIRIDYKFGPLKWGGIYWQNQPDNFGDEAGNNYSKEGYKKISFWVKGVTGKEIVEFKAGGINDASKRFHDSFMISTGKTMLSKEWTQYTLDVSKSDLSSVIGGFCWVASKDYNDAKSITFFLDDIYYE